MERLALPCCDGEQTTLGGDKSYYGLLTKSRYDTVEPHGWACSELGGEPGWSVIGTTLTGLTVGSVALEGSVMT
jgi:hypothetical protein